MFKKIKQYIDKKEEEIERASREQPQQWFKIECDFYSRTLYCPNWSDVMAFLKGNEMFAYTITPIEKSFYDFEDDEYVVVAGVLWGYSVHKVKHIR